MAAALVLVEALEPAPFFFVGEVCFTDAPFFRDDLVTALFLAVDVVVFFAADFFADVFFPAPAAGVFFAESCLVAVFFPVAFFAGAFFAPVLLSAVLFSAVLFLAVLLLPAALFAGAFLAEVLVAGAFFAVLALALVFGDFVAAAGSEPRDGAAFVVLDEDRRVTVEVAFLAAAAVLPASFCAVERAMEARPPYG